jgi:hypothetical protein
MKRICVKCSEFQNHLYLMDERITHCVNLLWLSVDWSKDIR